MLAFVGTAPGCTSPSPTPDLEPPAPAPSWLRRAPTGCAIGFSGPTLDPGDSIRHARRNAVARLIAGSARAQTSIDSTLLVDGGGLAGSGEFTRLDITGVGRGTRIVTMWAEATRDPRSDVQVRHVYALACREAAAPAGIADPSYPDWVINLPAPPGKTCAIGVGGPTQDPRDQPEAALRDGRRALAQALETRIHRIIVDTGRRAIVGGEVAASERAVERAEAADALEEEWLDSEGLGPLGLKAVLYGLVCVAV